MNKIININLGKFPFIIDTDAFDVLDDYLAELKAYFSKSEGSEEIMQDIESRIAEILNKKWIQEKSYQSSWSMKWSKP